MLQHRLIDIRPWAQEIADRAASSPNHEICGVILRGAVVELENQAEVASSYFVMGPDFEQYRSRALCIWHTHVGIETPAALSPVDIIQSKEQRIPYLSYQPQFHQWDYFDPTALHPFPLEADTAIAPTQLEYYLLWRFEYGRSDCYSLVRSWYAGILGIDLEDYHRLPLDDAPIQFSFDRFEQQGFIQVDKTDFQTHDLLCMDIMGGRYNHIGVIANAEYNQLLHNLGEGRYSEIVPYDQSWRDRTRAVFRHQLLINDHC